MIHLEIILFKNYLNKEIFTIDSFNSNRFFIKYALIHMEQD